MASVGLQDLRMAVSLQAMSTNWSKGRHRSIHGIPLACISQAPTVEARKAHGPTVQPPSTVAIPAALKPYTSLKLAV